MPLTGAGDGHVPEVPFPDNEGARSFKELIESGILWAINEEMFWPYGAALALHADDKGEIIGWSLQRSPDGTRVDIPPEIKEARWQAYQRTLHEQLGWEAGW